MNVETRGNAINGTSTGHSASPLQKEKEREREREKERKKQKARNNDGKVEMKANVDMSARPICFGPLEDVGAVCLDVGLMYGQPIIIVERMEGRIEYISWKRKQNRTKRGVPSSIVLNFSSDGSISSKTFRAKRFVSVTE
uniref:Uncharacterized protein n=1 Tax=Vespula pensylvanica TaxID=30213 RepID=A0A834NZB4_VESPE|nr:hypothetical protein H0235_009751 [Vespula pensylvanica]